MIVKFGMGDKVRISDPDIMSQDINGIKNVGNMLFEVNGAHNNGYVKQVSITPLGVGYWLSNKFKGLWFDEDSLTLVNIKKIDFKILKSVCVNWDEESRRTENYENIKCQITGDICCLVKCPVVTGV